MRPLKFRIWDTDKKEFIDINERLIYIQSYDGSVWDGVLLPTVTRCAQVEVVGNIYEAEKALADLAEIDAPLI